MATIGLDKLYYAKRLKQVSLFPKSFQQVWN